MLNNILPLIHLESDTYNTQIARESSSFVDVFNAIKKMDKLPLNAFDIRFSDNIWDFSSIRNKNISISKENIFIMNFNTIPDEFKDIVKFYVYDCICDVKTTFSRTSYHLNQLKEFISYLVDSCIPSFDVLSEEIISGYVEALKSAKFSDKEYLQPTTIIEKRMSILKFLRFYSSKIEELDYSSLYNILEPSKKEYQQIKVQRENSKKADIPQQYFNELLSSLVKVMNNPNEKDDDRANACIFIILSQTALRPSEVALLRVGALEPIKILNNTKTAYFMNYISPKAGEKGVDNSFFKGKTYINELSKLAYDTLVDIYAEKRKLKNIDLLFCPGNIKFLPKENAFINGRLKDFLLRHSNEINCVNVSSKYPKLTTTTIEKAPKDPYVTKGSIAGWKNDDVFSYITAHQFRVHVCTELYYKKVPLDVIQFYMSHLSEDMTDYYIRRPERTEEEDKIVESILTDIIKDGVTPIGSKSDELKEKIDEFIAKNNFSVEKDLPTIISKLKRRVPIKLKYNGVCIKSGAKRPCSMDADTDEFYCASDICPNNFRLYWNLDTTYKEFQDFLLTIEHNKNNGFTRQAQHEERKLKFIVSDRLIPELEQLQEQLELKGSDYIINKHPYLENFITNYDTIYKEVSTWIQ